MSERRTSFGELLRQLRSAAALSQEALAERAGLSKRGISDLERGARLAPRLETVRLLADALMLGESDRMALLAAARPTVTVLASAKPAGASPQGLLPLPPTRLIGREEEITTLCDLLGQQDVHLVTLTGTGGTGKTHLALAVAASVVDRYPDGGVFLDLSALTDPNFVVPAIAAIVGVRETAGESMRETVSRYLRERRLLLVLDNCEQVLEAHRHRRPSGWLPASRHPGHQPGAVAHPGRVRDCGASFAPPRSTRLPPLAELGNVPAVALFVERAHAASAGFALTVENAPAVAAICHRLDGLPLAIELAAARIKVLPPAALLARLEHRLPLLTGGGRDLPVRQRTMRDAIAWSHDLLTAEEQAVFRRLAVFAGGFTLAAAEAVAGSKGELAALDGIVALVEQSLLRHMPGSGDEPRFTMLETIREYGLERLATSGDEEATQRAYGGFFLALAEEAEPQLIGPEQGEWLTRLETEHDNLRAVLVWAEAQDHETGLRLAAALWRFWYARGHLNEGRGWLERALALDGAGQSAARVRALHGAGVLADLQGDPAQAEALVTESLALARSLQDRRGEALALVALGLVAAFEGDTAREVALTEASLALWRDLDDAWGAAGALDNLGTRPMSRATSGGRRDSSTRPWP